MSGWFGLTDHVLHVLRTVGADRDTDGKFMVAGSVALGLGGDETVVGEDAVYFVRGQSHSLAAAMDATSYGVRGITVI